MSFLNWKDSIVVITFFIIIEKIYFFVRISKREYMTRRLKCKTTNFISNYIFIRKNIYIYIFEFAYQNSTSITLLGYLFHGTPCTSPVVGRAFISTGSEARIFSGEIFTARFPYLYRFGTRSREI